MASGSPLHALLRNPDNELCVQDFQTRAWPHPDELVDRLLDSVVPPPFDAIVITDNEAAGLNLGIVEFEILSDVLLGMVAVDVDPIKVRVVEKL